MKESLSISGFILCLLLVAPLQAKNIDLSTLPSRDSVTLTVYNAEDLTLVRETRQLSIKKGINTLQFSWANTQIDPTSVQLKLLAHQSQVRLQHTTFPHSKPQMLYWQLSSRIETRLPVEITYFTSGISWQASYTGILDQQGDNMLLDGFVTVSNQSGEDYEDAKVRLVVGKINLVETVSALAAQAGLKNTADEQQGRKAMRYREAEKMMSRGAGKYALTPAPMIAADMAAPKEVAKESLSEYYIFSIEGRETIPHRWSKRLRSFTAEKVPVKTVYRYRPREYGNQLVKILLFGNKTLAGLGNAPLPEGEIQVYRENSRRSLEYLAGIKMKYVSVGDKVELNAGHDPAVVFKLRNLKNWRRNIWMYYKKGKVYKRIDDGHIVVDHHSTVAGWDDNQLFVQQIRNHTGKPIDVEIRRLITGDAEFISELDASAYDFQTVEIKTTLAASGQQKLYYQTVLRQGRNQKQNRLKIRRARVEKPVY